MIENLQEEKTKLEQLIKVVEADTVETSEKLRPSGTIKKPEYTVISANGNGKRKYLKKGEKKQAEFLAQQEYNQDLIFAAKKQIYQIDALIKSEEKWKLENVYKKISPTKKLLVKPYVVDDETYIKNWLAEPYTGKPFKVGDAEHKNHLKQSFRSKSECMISEILLAKGIPFKYEYPVYMEGFGYVYIDFTLLDIKARKEVRYEHFGMMGDPEYASMAISKLNLYARNNLVIGKNLLISMESGKSSLNEDTVDAMLNARFG